MATELELASAARDEQYTALKQEHDSLVEQCAPFRSSTSLHDALCTHALCRALMGQLASAEIEREKAMEEAETLASMNVSMMPNAATPL